MLLSKTLALVATTITTAVAYSHPLLETRNDLDFTPDDLEQLFERDLFDDDLDDMELFSRDAELDDEDELDLLYGRDLLDEDLDEYIFTARDLELDTEDTTTNVKRSPVPCFGCPKVGKAVKKTAVNTSQKLSSAASSVGQGASKGYSGVKSAAKGVGNFVKDSAVGPGAEHLARLPYMDPIGMAMGAHSHSPVSDGSEFFHNGRPAF